MLTHVFPNKDAWLDFRAGMFTSSNIHKLMADGKRAMTDEEIAAAKKENPRSKATTIYDENVLSEGAITYIEDVVSAQFAKREPDFYSKSMERGNTVEPKAALAIAKRFGFLVDGDDALIDVDFIYTSQSEIIFFADEEKRQGSTPDIIIPDYLIQIKSPDSKTHIKYLRLSNEEQFIEACYDYYIQMQHEMFMANKPRAYFASYDDRFYHPALQLHVIEIKRNEEVINKIQRKVKLAHAYKESVYVAEFTSRIEAYEANIDNNLI